MTAPKTPDELADALYAEKNRNIFTGQVRDKDFVVRLTRDELRQLARDAAALGAVKALRDAASFTNAPDVKHWILGRADRIEAGE